MTAMPESRRAAPRVRVALDLELARGKGSRVSGRTVDVGRGGMCVSTARPLAVDELLAFDLDLAGAGEARRVEGSARVLREQGVNLYALRFERLPRTDDAILDDLVARLLS